MQRFSSVPCPNSCNYHTNFTADRKRSLIKDRLHDCALPVPGKFIGMRDGNGIESGTHEALMLEKYGIPETASTGTIEWSRFRILRQSKLFIGAFGFNLIITRMLKQANTDDNVTSVRRSCTSMKASWKRVLLQRVMTLHLPTIGYSSPS